MVERISGTLLRDSPNLLASCRRLLVPIYECADELFSREVAGCSDAYLLKDDKDEIVGFFLVVWELIPIAEASMNTVYLGLAARSEHCASSGRELFVALNEDAVEWERRHSSSLILWWTTSSPMPYWLASRAFSRLVPSPQGQATTFEIRIVEEIAKHRGWSDLGQGSPFLFREVGVPATYSDIHQERNRSFSAKKPLPLFEDRALPKHPGDRLLCFARPRHEEDDPDFGFSINERLSPAFTSLTERL